MSMPSTMSRVNTTIGSTTSPFRLERSAIEGDQRVPKITFGVRVAGTFGARIGTQADPRRFGCNLEERLISPEVWL
jgi:hypothetical protein